MIWLDVRVGAIAARPAASICDFITVVYVPISTIRAANHCMFGIEDDTTIIREERQPEFDAVRSACIHAFEDERAGDAAHALDHTLAVAIVSTARHVAGGSRFEPVKLMYENSELVERWPRGEGRIDARCTKAFIEPVGEWVELARRWRRGRRSGLRWRWRRRRRRRRRCGARSSG